MGTEDGLNRYDGSRFQVFRNVPGNHSSLSGNIVSDLLEDENGLLWIATIDGGLTRYDYRLSPDKQFKQYRHIPGDSSSIPVNIINDLLQDNSGYLWLATSGSSVLRFNKKTERFEEPVPTGTRTALKMLLDEQGILWVGRQGGGILKVNTKTLAYESDLRYQNLYSNLPHATVTSFFKDKENHIWFGSWDNVLYRYNSISTQEEVFSQQTGVSFPVEEATSFAEDDQRRLWIGGRYAGLTLYDKNQNRFYNYRYDPSREGSIADDHVNCIYRCRSGMFWLGTNKGVSVYNPAQQSFVQTFLPATGKKILIHDFYKEENGDLWIGTNNGIYMQKKGSAGFLHKPVVYKGEELAVTKFYTASDGRFYVGTNYSLFVYDKKNHSVSLLPGTEKDPVMNKIIDSRVISIAEDRIEGNPVLLVSPYGHYIAYYDLKEQRWVSRTDTVKNIIPRLNLKDNLVRKFYRDKDNRLWLATGKNGLGEWVNHSLPVVDWRINNPSVKGAISNNNAYDITEDTEGNLWVSTYGGGLNYFNVQSGKFEHVAASNNLLEGIQTDNNGNVWMISNGHLHRYDPPTKSYSSFQLPDLEKSGGVKGYIFKDEEGFMYVAGINYFIRFKPEEITEKNGQPNIYLMDFKIFNTSYNHLLFQPAVSLRYKQNYFTIEYAAPEFMSGPVQYSYRLDGRDDDWVDAGDRNFAHYSNLDAGNYTFIVRATNKKGNWSENIATLAIRIKPPFRKTFWFYFICAAFIGSLVYAAYRYRINELLKRQAIRNKIAQDLHDSVGSALSSISVYSQVAKIRFERGNSTELKDVLDKISITSTDMISEMNDIVWTLNPQNDSMEKMLQRMESFAKPLLATRNISFAFNYDPAVQHLDLPMEKRKNFYLIFKEAINNVLKYSGCRNLQVSLQLHHHRAELIVKDDGIGFDPEQIKTQAASSMSGNGLNNMKRRAEEMKGECTVESAPGMGTTVTLNFPLP